MSSQTTWVWDDWLKNGTPYHDSDTFVSGTVNFKDAVQFRTVVLAVEIDEPTTKKIRECGAKETLSLILVIIASCLLFPINIAEREQSRTVGLPDSCRFDIGRFRVEPTDLRKVSTSEWQICMSQCPVPRNRAFAHVPYYRKLTLHEIKVLEINAS